MVYYEGAAGDCSTRPGGPGRLLPRAMARRNRQMSLILADQYSATTQAVSEAIADSIQRDEVVMIECVRDGIWGAVTEELDVACDGNVENGEVMEYWGKTDDGDDWRVHVRRA